MKHFSKLRIPEDSNGNFSVKHSILKGGTCVPINSLRNKMFYGAALEVMGEKRPSGMPDEMDRILSGDHLMHELNENSNGGGGTWMSDRPQEVWQMRMAAKQLHGNVLIGGLGLGLILTMLPKAVKKVTIVERESDVIDLIWGSLEKSSLPTHSLRSWMMEENCIKRHLKMCKQAGTTYDSAFFDTWAPTGQRVLDKWTIPIRKLCEGIVDNYEVHCWAELEMIGQVAMNLQTRYMMPDAPFTKITDEMIADPSFKRAVGCSFSFHKYMHEWKKQNPKKDQREHSQLYLGQFCRSLMHPMLMRSLKIHWKANLT